MFVVYCFVTSWWGHEDESPLSFLVCGAGECEKSPFASTPSMITFSTSSSVWSKNSRENGGYSKRDEEADEPWWRKDDRFMLDNVGIEMRSGIRILTSS